MSNYKHGGLDEKYIITKKNGKKIDPEAVYFVLRLDKDPHALNAIDTYVKSVAKDNLELADDLIILVQNIIMRQQIKNDV